MRDRRNKIQRVWYAADGGKVAEDSDKESAADYVITPRQLNGVGCT